MAYTTRLPPGGDCMLRGRGHEGGGGTYGEGACTGREHVREEGMYGERSPYSTVLNKRTPLNKPVPPVPNKPVPPINKPVPPQIK